MTDAHVLDDWIGGSLRGAHRGFAVVAPGAVRYDPAVGPFGAVEDGDVAAIDGLPVDDLTLPTPEPVVAPAGWTKTLEFRAFQLVDAAVPDPDPYEAAQPLTIADVPAMLELVALTRPGPFAVRTIELGGYVGVRQGDWLVAMAGRRAAPDGWTEISAVCTHPDFRGRGFGARLLLEVLRGIRAEGRRGFLTVLDGNPARGLYESLGFVERRPFVVARLSREAD